MFWLAERGCAILYLDSGLFYVCVCAYVSTYPVQWDKIYDVYWNTLGFPV